ncbi:unnamed protein product [Boreogadus saida]
MAARHFPLVSIAWIYAALCRGRGRYGARSCPVVVEDSAAPGVFWWWVEDSAAPGVFWWWVEDSAAPGVVRWWVEDSVVPGLVRWTFSAPPPKECIVLSQNWGSGGVGHSDLERDPIKHQTWGNLKPPVQGIQRVSGHITLQAEVQISDRVVI